MDRQDAHDTGYKVIRGSFAAFCDISIAMIDITKTNKTFTIVISIFAILRKAAETCRFLKSFVCQGIPGQNTFGPVAGGSSVSSGMVWYQMILDMQTQYSWNYNTPNIAAASTDPKTASFFIWGLNKPNGV